MNKKYIYIGIGIVLVLLIILGVFYFLKKDSIITYHTITASDGSCKIQLPDTIDYRSNSKENNDFIIDLYSRQDEMFLYVSRIEKNRAVSLEEIANDDKKNYLNNKENIREDSGIKKTDLKDYTAYEYNFIHYDSSYGKDFYTYVVWIETPKNLYVLNFEIVTESIEKCQDMILNIKNSFVEL